jgi:hypothetical protein
VLTLLLPQARQTHRRAQFQGLGLLAGAPQQGLIGRVLKQGVLKKVRRLWWQPLLVQELQQLPENLSRKDCAPIIEESREVMWSAAIFVVFYSGDHPHADPQTALS